jgi:hypothetical protein
VEHIDEPPDEPYKRGLYLLLLDLPPGATMTIKNLLPGLRDGPCELLIREQDMPPIDELDRVTKYSIGVAMRYIGYALDAEEQSTDEALRVYGALAEAAGAHMERYGRGDCGPFNVSELIDALLRITGPLFAHLDIRTIIEAYIEAALTMKPVVNDLPLHEGYVHADQAIVDACNALIGRVPTFHIASSVFDQSEVAKWQVVRCDTSLIPCSAFLIAVDDETWLPVKDALYAAQSEWLLVDARQPLWYLYERVKFRGIGVKANAPQICGVTYDSRIGKSRSIPSTSVYVEDDGSVRPFQWPEKQAGRLATVAFTFMMLLRNERVTVKPARIVGHWEVALPEGRTVDQLVDKVLSYRKIS